MISLHSMGIKEHIQVSVLQQEMSSCMTVPPNTCTASRRTPTDTCVNSSSRFPDFFQSTLLEPPPHSHLHSPADPNSLGQGNKYRVFLSRGLLTSIYPLDTCAKMSATPLLKRLRQEQMKEIRMTPQK